MVDVSQVNGQLVTGSLKACITGIDPFSKLIDCERDDNVVAAEHPSVSLRLPNSRRVGTLATAA